MVKVIVFIWFLYICYQLVKGMLLTFFDDEDEDLETYLANEDAAVSACMKALFAVIAGVVVGLGWILFFSGGMK